MEKGQARFQMLDNYVKEYTLHLVEKIPEDAVIDFNGQMGFRLINISEQEELLIGEIELLNNIDIMSQDQKKGEIHIIMRGLFSIDNQMKKEEFEKMLKINGAATLSQFIRTYIHANTSLGGMPGIRIPMINFVDLFTNKNEKENEDK